MKQLTWSTCLKAGVSVLTVYFITQFWPELRNVLVGFLGALTPLIIGCIIAYAVNIVMSGYEKHFFPKKQGKAMTKLRRPLCLLLAFLTLIAIVTAIIWLVVPQLVSCVRLIIDQIPKAINDSIVWAEGTGFFTPETIGKLRSINWASRIDQIFQMITSGISNVTGVVIDAVSSVFSGIVTAVLSLIFAVYILLSKDKLYRQYHVLAGRYMRKTWIAKIDYVADILNQCFRRFIVGQCTEALILGVLCMLGMWILRLPYPPMVGALIAFTALVPVAGAFIGGAIGAFMILMVSPIKALIFIVFIVILQQLEGNIIYPKVVGTSLRLPAIWVLTAVTVGGGVMGIAGMLLGVPLTAAIYRIIREDVQRHNAPQKAE